eukprot:c17102_g1_i1 orf=474-890(-)
MMDRPGEDLQSPMIQIERPRGHIELQANFSNARRECSVHGSNSRLALRDATPPVKPNEDQEVSPQPNDGPLVDVELSPAHELSQEVCSQFWVDVRPDSSTIHTNERLLPPQIENELLQHHENPQLGVQRTMVWSEPAR